MKYEGKTVDEYSHEEIIEILKDCYLIRKNDSKKYHSLVSEDNFTLLRAEVASILKDHKSFDDIHRQNIEKIVEKRNAIEAESNFPIDGDYILLKTGEYLRVTVTHNKLEFQAYPCGSFHLGNGGYISVSGTCGDLFLSRNFKLTKEEKRGSFWFWHTQRGVGGGNGVHASALFRVFREIE